MNQDTREIAWIAAVRKEFESFPSTVQRQMQLALTIAAEGRKADIAKPMRGLGSGVFEIAPGSERECVSSCLCRSTWAAVWVIHAFQKKSTRGIKTPKREIVLIQDRIKRLKEQLKHD